MNDTENFIPFLYVYKTFFFVPSFSIYAILSLTALNTSEELSYSPID